MIDVAGKVGFDGTKMEQGAPFREQFKDYLNLRVTNEDRLIELRELFGSEVDQTIRTKNVGSFAFGLDNFNITLVGEIADKSGKGLVEIWQKAEEAKMVTGEDRKKWEKFLPAEIQRAEMNAWHIISIGMERKSARRIFLKNHPEADIDRLEKARLCYEQSVKLFEYSLKRFRGSDDIVEEKDDISKQKIIFTLGSSGLQIEVPFIIKDLAWGSLSFYSAGVSRIEVKTDEGEDLESGTDGRGIITGERETVTHEEGDLESGTDGRGFIARERKKALQELGESVGSANPEMVKASTEAMISAINSTYQYLDSRSFDWNVRKKYAEAMAENLKKRPNLFNEAEKGKIEFMIKAYRDNSDVIIINQYEGAETEEEQLEVITSLWQTMPLEDIISGLIVGAKLKIGAGESSRNSDWNERGSVQNEAARLLVKSRDVLVKLTGASSICTFEDLESDQSLFPEVDVLPGMTGLLGNEEDRQLRLLVAFLQKNRVMDSEWKLVIPSDNQDGGNISQARMRG